MVNFERHCSIQSEQNKRFIINFYDARLAKSKCSRHVAVGWLSESGQRQRFDYLLDIEGFAQRKVSVSSILDVGCGLGDLLGHLRSKGYEMAGYTGIDINPKFIMLAKKSYPLGNFIEADICSHDLPQADFAFASGIFTIMPVKDLDYLKRILLRMHNLCILGLAFNFFEEKIGWNKPFTTYQVDEIMEMCEKEFGNDSRIFIEPGPAAFEHTVYVVKKR